MADDPWAEYRNAEAPQQAPSDPWSVYRSPGTASPVVSTPGAPQSMTASPEDKYRAAAIEERDRALKLGIPLQEGYTSRLARGVGMGWTDELMAAGATPFEMIKRGLTDPREAYRYTKARENLRGEQTDVNTRGALGTGAEVLGSLATGGGVLGAGERAAAARIPFTAGAQIPANVVNWGSNVAKGAGLGAFSGAGEAKDVEGIPKGMLMGGVLGAGIGGALPGVATIAGQGLRTLQMPRLRDPQNIAIEHVAKVARDAGVEPAEIVRRVADANAAGQPYAVADALGKEGQRKLTAMAKVPGPQREAITEALVARDLNMPTRTGEEVGRALGAPTTARAAQDELITQAGARAAPIYREAEQHPTWSNRLQEFISDPIAQQGLRHGVELQRLRTVGTDRPFRPQDAMITDFNAAGEPVWSGVPNMQTLNTLKTGLDRMVEANTDTVTGRVNAQGHAIMGFRNRMLEEMDAINPTYRRARATYAEPMQVRDAVTTGREMATRGRAADNIETFRNMAPPEGTRTVAGVNPEQQGVRIGYADALRGQMERTGNLPTGLREKSTKGAQELSELSLYQGPNRPGEPDQLRKFLNREEQMQRTSKAALGGSSTVENLADVAAAPGGGDALGLVSSAASGDAMGIVRKLAGMVPGALKGESEAQRVAITNALLSRDPTRVQEMADRIAAHELRRRGVNPWTGTARYPVGQ